MKALLIVTLLFSAVSSFAQSDSIDLYVFKIKKERINYNDFCDRHPGECDISGVDKVEMTDELWNLVNEVNKAVNTEIKFYLDDDQYGTEEYWNYPTSGMGDCEDNALEKRRRLVAAGVPRGALKMGTAFHNEMYYAHALLYLETDKGTFILDQDNREILIWHQTPYILESRERVDGSWEMFEQIWD